MLVNIQCLIKKTPYSTHRWYSVYNHTYQPLGIVLFWCLAGYNEDIESHTSWLVYWFIYLVLYMKVTNDLWCVIHIIKNAHKGLIIACHVLCIHELRSLLRASNWGCSPSLALRNKSYFMRICITLYDISRIDTRFRSKVFISPLHQMKHIEFFYTPATCLQYLPGSKTHSVQISNGVSFTNMVNWDEVLDTKLQTLFLDEVILPCPYLNGTTIWKTTFCIYMASTSRPWLA